MTFRERYSQLRDPAFARQIVVRSSYATMALEDQTVPLERVEAMYDEMLRNKHASGQFQNVLAEPQGELAEAY